MLHRLFVRFRLVMIGYCLCSATFLSGLDVRSASMNFRQLTISKQAAAGPDESELRGVLYFAEPDMVAIDLAFPILQKIFISNNGTLIYYPENREALRFPPDSAAVMPLTGQMRTLLSQDRGLSAAGFKLDSLEYDEQGRAVSRWLPPEGDVSGIGEVRLFTSDQGNIVRSETLGQKGRLITTMEYSRFTEVQGYAFPQTVITRQYLPDGQEQVEMQVHYDDVRFNISLPPNIADFKLPDDVQVQELEW